VADVEGAAGRLLLALNVNQAHGREGAVVEPGEQEARDAGLRPGSSLYRAVVWWLLDKGALVPTGRPTRGPGTRPERSTVTSRSGSPGTAWTCCVGHDRRNRREALREARLSISNVWYNVGYVVVPRAGGKER
jgi:hypothetical protein